MYVDWLRTYVLRWPLLNTGPILCSTGMVIVGNFWFVQYVHNSYLGSLLLYSVYAYVQACVYEGIVIK